MLPFIAPGKNVADSSPARGSREHQKRRRTRIASGVIAYPRTVNNAHPTMRAIGSPARRTISIPVIARLPWCQNIEAGMPMHNAVANRETPIKSRDHGAENVFVGEVA